MKNYSFCKRVIDIALSGIAILFFSPLLCILILLIKMDSKGPAFFMQVRIGQGFKPFKLIKFRTMSVPQKGEKREFNPGDCMKITKVGNLLRKGKLDELPELFNILKGDMSIVGPRPEVEKYVYLFHEDYMKILKVKPGLSDFASIKYRDEEKILAERSEPERHYINVILPDKIVLAKKYIDNLSIKKDFYVIMNTIKAILT